MPKPSWDEVWMELALKMSERSNDPRLKVGAVIVTQDNESVLSFGYNGDHKGGDNVPDSLEPGKSGFIHAEVNATTKLNYLDPRSKKIYLTHSPCVVCSRVLVNANIQEVIYKKEYRITTGLDILRSCDILVRQMED
ncbi:MAG TPA: deaminase [Patescibacteria group bacterium]|nr:deaminase [Patescibacteria group bacterium]